MIYTHRLGCQLTRVREELYKPNVPRNLKHYTHSSPATSISSAMPCMHACTQPWMQASSKTECKHSPLYCRQASECTIHNGIGTMHASCMLSNSKRSDFERFKTSSSCTYACMQPFFSACRFAVALSSQSNSCHAYATTSDHRVV